jgi:hypothetical protein
VLFKRLKLYVPICRQTYNKNMFFTYQRCKQCLYKQTYVCTLRGDVFKDLSSTHKPTYNTYRWFIKCDWLRHDRRGKEASGESRSQSYDFWIYSYNASVVVGQSVFQSRNKYFGLQNALGYTLLCKKYNAGVVIRDRRIGSWSISYI